MGAGAESDGSFGRDSGVEYPINESVELPLLLLFPKAVKPQRLLV